MAFWRKDDKPTLPKSPPRSRRAITYGEKMIAEQLGKTVQVRIYEYLGGHYALVHKRNVSHRRESLLWNGAIYALNKERIIWERDSWGKLRATLLFKMFEAGPMSLDEPIQTVEPIQPQENPLKIDGRKIATIANKHAWKNLYPSTDKMLQLIALIAVVGLIISVGVNAYLLGNPDAAKQLINSFNNQPGTQGGQGQPQTAHPQTGGTITK